MIPGEIVHPDDEPVGRDDDDVVEIEVSNASDRAIHVGSHYPFYEANPRLVFDRQAAYGRYLDVPGGLAVRFEPGDSRRVTLRQIRGARIVRGFHGLVDGPLDDPAVKAAAEQRMHDRGFSTT